MTHTPGFFLLMAAALAAAPASAQTGFPFQDEGLHYTVNWPSGLSLGDGTLNAHHTAKGWDFEVGLDAAVPGFAIKDKFRASATAGLCSTELTRDISQGGKKVKEKTTFDQEKATAHRATEYPADGGTSDLNIGACARDAITFVYFARKELGQGRVPPAQKVYFGSEYSVHMEYTGAQTITLGDKKEVTDHLVVSVKGPRADLTVEVYYARDAARTPLLIKIPQAVGTLSMELVR
jgi:Protein of unknown function (DUF3108)